MPFDPASFAISAGTSILGPLVGKGLGSMFGLDEASPEERKAAADREAALQKLRDAAEGRTASAAQLQAQQQQQRTIQALSSMAARGTAQQQAGAQRAAMQAAPEVMAQQGATAAMARAAEMSAARRDLGAMQLQASQQQAAEGANDRKYMQSLIGAGVSGAAGAGAAAMTQSPDAKKPLVPPPPPGGSSTGTSAAALTAPPEQALGTAPPAASVPAASAELPASGGLALRGQNIGAGVGYRAPQTTIEQSPLSLGQPNLKTSSGKRQARGQGLASYLTNGGLSQAGDVTLTPNFSLYGGY